jgi:hypothetical protein
MREPRRFPHLFPHPHRWLFALAGLFGLASGTVCVASLPARLREAESAKWPVTRGRVVKVAMVEGPECPRERVIGYAFLHRGRTWTVAEQEPLPVTEFGRTVRDDYAQYRPGTEAVVHFNPEDPSQAWVRREETTDDSLIFAVATCVTGLVLAFLADALRRSELKRLGAGIRKPDAGPARLVLPAF